MKRLALAVALVVTACAGPPAVGTRDQAVAVSPFAYDFGSIAVGATSAPRLFIVSPVGVEYDVITSITESCADFDLDLSQLENPAEVFRECDGGGDPLPNQFAPICTNHTQRFTVTFHPSFGGPQSCPITIQLSGQGELVFSVSGTGLAPPVALTLVTPAASTLDFGDVRVGAASSPLPVIIRSDGTGDLDLVDAVLSGPDAAAFALATTDSEPLGPGATFTWQLTCTPPAAIDLAATLTITSNAPDSPHEISIACRGIQSNLTVDPSPVQFAETLIGDQRVAPVRLGNAGTAPLTIVATTITAGPFTAPDVGGAMLMGGQELELEILFTPTAEDVGQDVRGTLVVTFDGGESRTIDLVGPARDATLSLTPGGAIDFGTVCAGQSLEQVFVAVNGGSGAVDLLDATASGPGFALTPIAPPSFPAPLPARGAGSATFRVTAEPPLGDVTGELTVTTAIPGSTPTVIALAARGQDSGVGASPGAVDFGGVDVGQPSGGRTVRISNCDLVPLEVTAATVTGDAAAEFVLIATEPLPLTLPPRGVAQFVIELRPTTAGDKLATLTVTHASGTVEVPLTGLGVGDAAGGGGRGSYYACSTGGGGAAFAPLALAIALLVRRRRR